MGIIVFRLFNKYFLKTPTVKKFVCKVPKYQLRSSCLNKLEDNYKNGLFCEGCRVFAEGCCSGLQP